MDRLTRHELKQDEFVDTLERIEDYFKKNYKGILSVTGIIAVVIGLVVGLRIYNDRQDAEANALLGAAIKTYQAYVGPSLPGQPPPEGGSFAAPAEKYKKALEQFSDLVAKYPRTKAADFARYHVGLCQAQLGDSAGAIKTLQDASSVPDKNLAAVAKYALAGEWAATGKVDEAAKTYQDLADHPTATVPQTMALMALADAYRATQPAKARQIYERLQKDAASGTMLASALHQQLASLPK